MKIYKFLIAKGNPTALVKNCPLEKRIDFSRQLLKEVEQVGFISEIDNYPRLEMMGNELCINATIAYASTLNLKGMLFTSGFNEEIKYKNDLELTSIEIPKQYKKEGNIVLFKGIGYIFFPVEIEDTITKDCLKELAIAYDLPAFGGIFYKINQIHPSIFVRNLDSFVKESACGSGSLAYAIFSQQSDIVQPSGGVIHISQLNQKFQISAKVEKYIDNKKFR